MSKFPPAGDLRLTLELKPSVGCVIIESFIESFISIGDCARSRRNASGDASCHNPGEIFLTRVVSPYALVCLPDSCQGSPSIETTYHSVFPRPRNEWTMIFTRDQVSIMMGRKRADQLNHEVNPSPWLVVDSSTLVQMSNSTPVAPPSPYPAVQPTRQVTTSFFQMPFPNVVQINSSMTALTLTLGSPSQMQTQLYISDELHPLAYRSTFDAP
ncbi:hypothetical protein XA68_13267 [Ophiocordyceps unilateralis]|uniref:Uncharacterized protein n=1 Tax=Ophiocordyceps unilateralis TaxID=268505 RepID=A0A2A9PME4_OPHUN|nr:hypothetical protein XA68_13267 [Ophiocordyceps unilateralis]